MYDDKKNIPDAGKVDNPPELGKVEPAKAAPSCRIRPPRPKRRLPKTRTLLLRLWRVRRSRARTRNRPQSPGMGDPAPAGKVVDFTAAREGAAKGKPPEKVAAPDKGKQADKRRMRPSPAGAAHPRLTRRLPTRPSRNLRKNVPKQTACRERRSRYGGGPGSNRAPARCGSVRTADMKPSPDTTASGPAN